MRYYVYYLHFSDNCPILRHSNHVKKAGAYNGRNVGINMPAKMTTIIKKM